VSRGQLERRLANVPRCLIGMEVCSGAHYIGRQLEGLGHDVRLIPAQYVKPFLKGHKNDYRDAEAIAEAVQRPTMQFVLIKTPEQMDLLALHKVRSRLVRQRTGTINQIRGFLIERGITVQQRPVPLRKALVDILASDAAAISPRIRRLTHHPHVHMIVPGGGLSADTSKWIACRPNFFLPVRVLSRLFRRLFLTMLAAAHEAGQLKFFGDHAGLSDKAAFAAFLAPWAEAEWVVYAKEPFGGPEEVLRYLSRYTHRVAISNRRLVSADDAGVTFKCKDYRIDGPGRYTTMTLHLHEFIRRLLMHVLPKGLHRIRHYGLLANGNRADNIARVRELLAMAPRAKEPEEVKAAETDQPCVLPHPCPCCGGRMLIIETFASGCEPKYRPAPTMPAITIDTS
jgi:hypothetical protein